MRIFAVRSPSAFAVSSVPPLAVTIFLVLLSAACSSAAPVPGPSAGASVGSSSPPLSSPSPADPLLARQCDAATAAYAQWQDEWLPAESAIEKASPADRRGMAGSHLKAGLLAIERLRSVTVGARSTYLRHLAASAAVFTVRISEIILSHQKTGTWPDQDWNDLEAAGNELALSLNGVRNTCPGGIFSSAAPSPTLVPGVAR